MLRLLQRARKAARFRLLLAPLVAALASRFRLLRAVAKLRLQPPAVHAPVELDSDPVDLVLVALLVLPLAAVSAVALVAAVELLLAAARTVVALPAVAEADQTVVVRVARRAVVATAKNSHQWTCRPTQQMTQLFRKAPLLSNVLPRLRTSAPSSTAPWPTLFVTCFRTARWSQPLSR